MNQNGNTWMDSNRSKREIRMIYIAKPSSNVFSLLCITIFGISFAIMTSYALTCWVYLSVVSVS